MEELSRRERKKRNTKAKILKKARRIFEKKGYDNTSIEDIAEAVDISKTTFFNYFPSKDSLLRELSDEEIEDVSDYLVTDLAGEESAVRKIMLMIEKIYFDSIKYPYLNSRILFTTFPQEGQEPSNMRNEYIKIFSGLAAEAIEKHEVSNRQAASEIVQAILICCYGMIIDCFSAGGKENARQRYDLAMSILLAGIGAKEEYINHQ